MIVSVADRLQDVGEYYFSKKLEVIQKMRAQGHDVISLGIGSPDLVPPSQAIDAAIEAIRAPQNHGYASYRSSPELRKAMTDWYQKTYGVTLDPAREVLPLLGSKEGILYLSMAILNPGDGVLIPNPGYPAYSSVSRLLGAKVHFYDLTDETGWLPDLERLEKMDLTGIKLMWVNYPHMPTGKQCDAGFFRKLVEFGKRKRILICNDNPYSLVLNTQKPFSVLSADPSREVAVELNSLSKSTNMAGWRVGMLMGAQAVIEAVLQVKSNVDSGMFLPVQRGAIAALQADEAWHQERNQTYQRRRELIWKLFDQLDFAYDRNQVGLFVWAKAPDSVSSVEAFVDEVLEKAHVFIVPGMIFGTNGLRYARASLCASESVIAEALKRVEGLAR